MKQKTIIYTDGGARHNPGIGGWGAVLEFPDGRRLELKGGEKHTTNNRMELTAAIKALERCPEGGVVEIYTDSTYLRDGIVKWIENWKRNGWKTASKKPVKNRELWERLDNLVSQHKVVWHWVRAHNGNIGNERADRLANEAMDELS